MNDFGQRILNETNLLVDDKAHYFEKLLDNPSDLVTWNDIERCVNQTELYKFELIDQNSTKIEIPQSGKNWIYDKARQTIYY